MSNGNPVNINPEAGSAPTPSAPVASTLQAPYAVRKIDLTFSFGQGSYGGSSPQLLTVTGLRVFAHVESITQPHAGSSLELRVYGLTLDHINQITKAGTVFASRRNAVLVKAGDAVSGMTTVADLYIQEAYPNFDGAADERHFYIYATGPGGIIQLQPVPPSSYPGSVPVSQVLQTLAGRIGYTLQNNGVNAVLQSPYFWGTAWQQVMSAVRAADCSMHADSVNKVLRIWPKNGSGGPSSVVISPQTGMIGFPKFQQNQIAVKTLFNPSLSLSPGLSVSVQGSEFQAANSKLTPTLVAHDLMSQTPGGPWETYLQGTPPTGG